MHSDEPIRDPLSEDWVGVTFTNPATGEAIEVLEVDPDGGRLTGRLTVRPGGSGPPRHVHPRQEEEFVVESGVLTVHVGDHTRGLAAGERVLVPPGTAHGFENRSAAPVVFTGTMRPGSDLLIVLATLSGLAWDGRVRDDGSPHLLQAMVFAQAMRDSMHLATPPRILQEIAWTVLAPVGRALGHRAVYDRYLRPAFWHQRAAG